MPVHNEKLIAFLFILLFNASEIRKLMLILCFIYNTVQIKRILSLSSVAKEASTPGHRPWGYISTLFAVI